MEIRKLVILAESAKYNNFCVAGIDIDTGEWIRPISEATELEEAVSLDVWLRLIFFLSRRFCCEKNFDD